MVINARLHQNFYSWANQPSKSRQLHGRRLLPNYNLQNEPSCKQQALLSYCYVYHLVGDTGNNFVAVRYAVLATTSNSSFFRKLVKPFNLRRLCVIRVN